MPKTNCGMMGANDDRGPANVRRKRKNRKYNYGTSLPPPEEAECDSRARAAAVGPEGQKGKKNTCTHIQKVQHHLPRGGSERRLGPVSPRRSPWARNVVVMVEVVLVVEVVVEVVGVVVPTRVWLSLGWWRGATPPVR